MTKQWEYKRVLVNAVATMEDDKIRGRSPSYYQEHPELWRRHRSGGEVAHPEIADSVEVMLNELGAEGWKLQTAVNLDSGADTGGPVAINTVEYIFAREPVA